MKLKDIKIPSADIYAEIMVNAKSLTADRC